MTYEEEEKEIQARLARLNRQYVPTEEDKARWAKQMQNVRMVQFSIVDVVSEDAWKDDAYRTYKPPSRWQRIVRWFREKLGIGKGGKG